MKTRIQTILSGGIAVLLLIAPNTVRAADRADEPKASHAVKSRSAVHLKMTMRTLWEEHITYTRNYIVSTLGDLADADAVAARLLKNQDEIGDAIKPYYGEEAGGKLAGLLRDHILIAAEVVKAAKADNKDELKEKQKKWSTNGKDLASFLAGANPHWSKKTLEDMLQKHLDLTTDEVVSRLKKDWEADIRAYDKGHQHLLAFSDTLVDGIVKQFPDKFTAGPVALRSAQ
jgi:hypothetical protein